MGSGSRAYLIFRYFYQGDLKFERQVLRISCQEVANLSKNLVFGVADVITMLVSTQNAVSIAVCAHFDQTSRRFHAEWCLFMFVA